MIVVFIVFQRHFVSALLRIGERVGVTNCVITHGSWPRHRTPEPLPAWTRRRGVTGCFLLSSSRLV